MSVGTKCPKHDVVLVSDGPTSATRSRAARPISWVTLTKFPDSLAVAAARIRLEAEGIPTFVDGERMGSPSMYRVATGGVKLQVPADLVDEARIILSQSWSLEGDDADVDDDLGDVDEDWEDSAAEPGAARLWVTEAILILVLVSPLIIYLLERLHGHRVMEVSESIKGSGPPASGGKSRTGRDQGPAADRQATRPENTSRPGRGRGSRGSQPG